MAAGGSAEELDELNSVYRAVDAESQDVATLVPHGDRWWRCPASTKEQEKKQKALVDFSLALRLAASEESVESWCSRTASASPLPG